VLPDQAHLAPVRISPQTLSQDDCLIRDPGDRRGSGRIAQGWPSRRTGLISRIWYDHPVIQSGV
jgi:hypothetical protein